MSLAKFGRNLSYLAALAGCLGLSGRADAGTVVTTGSYQWAAHDTQYSPYSQLNPVLAGGSLFEVDKSFNGTISNFAFTFTNTSSFAATFNGLMELGFSPGGPWEVKQSFSATIPGGGTITEYLSGSYSDTQSLSVTSAGDLAKYLGTGQLEPDYRPPSLAFSSDNANVKGAFNATTGVGLDRGVETVTYVIPAAVPEPPSIVGACTAALIVGACACWRGRMAR